MIKLDIKNDPAKVKQLSDLLKLTAGSGADAIRAREAIAAFVGPVITLFRSIISILTPKVFSTFGLPRFRVVLLLTPLLVVTSFV